MSPLHLTLISKEVYLMRQFLVMGFKTTSVREAGEVLHLGAVNSAAIAVLNAPEGGFARKELFELAIARQRKYFEVPAVSTVDTKGTKKK